MENSAGKPYVRGSSIQSPVLNLIKSIVWKQKYNSDCVGETIPLWLPPGVFHIACKCMVSLPLQFDQFP